MCRAPGPCIARRTPVGHRDWNPPYFGARRTARALSVFHGGVLKKLYPDHIYVEMNPLDAEPLGIEAKQKVLIASRRGQVTATVFITNTVQPGQLFIPMHYSVANQLTFPAFDPYSRQPAYKACAASVTPCKRG